MRKLILPLLLGICSSPSPAFPFGNDDVVNLLSAGFSEEIVVQAISSANSPTFDTSADGLINLKKAGASDAVIQKILSRQNPQSTPGSTAAKSDKFLSKGRILLVQGDKTTDLVAENHLTRNNFFTFAAASQYFDFLPPKALIRVSNGSPIFEASVDAQRAPHAALFLLRLETSSDKRTAKVLYDQGGGLGLPREDVLPLEFQQINDSNRVEGTRKAWRFKPKQPLEPGEYAVYHRTLFYGFGVDGPTGPR